MLWGLAIVGSILLAVAAVLAVYVDDWRRDLTQNHAQTDPDARDPQLQPVTTAVSIDQLSGILQRVPERLSNWSQPEVAQRGDGRTFYFVRTTPLMRFKDDIIVDLRPQGDAIVLTAESRSRLGKGDLGQNPRNLRELLSLLRSELEEQGQDRAKP